MKVGNLVDGLAVVDVKRVNKMNLIQFTKAISEYIEQGYKLDVNSSRQIGLVLQVDCYKLEDENSISSVECEDKTVESVAEAKYDSDTFTTPDQNTEVVATVKKTRVKKTT